jgi:hypothetical protein
MNDKLIIIFIPFFHFLFIKDCLALYITTIGCYGFQGSDINISLTAIGLLWNIADFVAKENPAVRASYPF